MSEAERARIAIIGGGIAGVATAWHLAERGESDVVILERTELTAGSTWHAAGNLPHFAGSLGMMEVMAHTKRLYRALEKRHGDIGLHLTGALRLASTPERVAEFERVAMRARNIDVPMDMLTPEEAKRRWPELEVHGLLAVLHDPLDGHIDPTSATNALAAEARDWGVRIRRHSPVTAVRREGDEWVLDTPKGEVRAGIVVNAAGFRAREVARMLGHDLPIAIMEHQYLVTEPIPALAERGEELPMIRDPEPSASYYLRQERGGVIIGPYEHDGHVWARGGVPPEFGQELLEPDLDRIAEHVAEAMERVPLAAEAGIRTIVNGPITYTPDGPPLVGAVDGVPNVFAHCGSSFGIAQGPGCGRVCAELILDGKAFAAETELNPNRFGRAGVDWDEAWVERCAKNVYDNEYAIVNERGEAGFLAEEKLREIRDARALEDA